MSSPGEPGRGVAAPPARSASRDTSRDDLLDYLSRNTLDADYALVAERHADGVRRPGARAATLVVLAVFAVLVVTLFAQTTRNAGSESDERRQLVEQVTGQRARLDQRQRQVAQLEAANDRTRASLLATGRGGVVSSVQRLGLLSGTLAVTGPGVLVSVDDAPNATEPTSRVLDSDLQILVNGLWQAGGEAIAINGQRLTVQSAIRLAGEAINVNFVGLSAPYRVEVIGNPDTLASRFAETSSGATWFDLQQRVGLRFRIEDRSSMTLPAADLPTLTYARPDR